MPLGLWQDFGDERPLSGSRAILRRTLALRVMHFDLDNNYGKPHGSMEIFSGAFFVRISAICGMSGDLHEGRCPRLIRSLLTASAVPLEVSADFLQQRQERAADYPGEILEGRWISVRRGPEGRPRYIRTHGLHGFSIWERPADVRLAATFVTHAARRVVTRCLESWVTQLPSAAPGEITVMAGHVATATVYGSAPVTERFTRAATETHPGADWSRPLAPRRC